MNFLVTVNNVLMVFLDCVGRKKETNEKRGYQKFLKAFENQLFVDEHILRNFSQPLRLVILAYLNYPNERRGENIILRFLKHGLFLARWTLNSK